MEVIPSIILEDYFKDEGVRQKHRKNEELLKMAVKNVDLSKELNLRGGLVYDFRDSDLFNIVLPNGERVFKGNHKYDFSEVKTVVACHYVFLKNRWVEAPASLNEVVDKISTAYPPLTGNLSCRSIRDRLTDHLYSKKLFVCDEFLNNIKPTYLPTKIEL